MFYRLFQWPRNQLLFRVLSNLQCGELCLTMPDGSTHIFTGRMTGPKADLHVHDDSAVGRVLWDGKMGFCEAFMDGQITSRSLPAFIELAARHDQYFEEQLKTNMFRKWGLQLFHRWRRNSKNGSERNIAHHYDLGNGFYKAWLDPTMTYSSAVFESDDDDLTAAQINKYRHLARLADIQPGDRVLEIGCGWGGFVKYASGELGAHVTGITISKEQFSYASQVIVHAGLSDRAQLRLMDYRDLEGEFDKIVSIEMFEAVGQYYWPVYFKTLSNVLKKGGRAALQSITIDSAAFDSYRNQPDFIQRYIFPGGMLPSMPMLERPVADAGLKLVSDHGYAIHYARTLDQWRRRFNASWPNLASGRFDQRFKRMWELYLAYCEGGFRSGLIDVKQILLMHK
jgi:cyclopropane-fatty-acyl-phospholipid synthase